MARSATMAFDGNAALETAAGCQLVLIEGGHRGERPARTRSRHQSSGELSLSQTALFLCIGLLVVALLCVSSLVADLHAASARDELLSSLPERTVVVHEGDTLWGIASETGVDELSTAHLVDWIEERNGLSGGVLVAGQELVIPTCR